MLKIAISAVVLFAVAAPAAYGAPAPATIDDTDVTLANADNGGWQAEVGITNLTTGLLHVSATKRGCALRAADGSATVRRARHAVVAVSIPATCRAEHGIAFRLVARAGRASQAFTIQAAPATTPVDWSALLNFLWALVAALYVVAWAALWWWLSTDHPFDGLRTPLTGLESTWSFGDSLVSNLTAASGLVAVVLGSSDFLKAILGPKAEAAIAVSAIAGTIALALVGAAGVLVLTLKDHAMKYVTVIGLCAGAVVALGAAAGQVWAVTAVLSDLKLGQPTGAIVWTAGILASLLLLAYTYRSLTNLLEVGTTVPEADLVLRPFLADEFAAALAAVPEPEEGLVRRVEVLNLLDDLPEPVAVAPAAASNLRGRSALL